MYKCESMKGNLCETVSFPLATCGNERESVVSNPVFFLKALKVVSASQQRCFHFHTFMLQTRGGEGGKR